jgi:hypothetical protein
MTPTDYLRAYERKKHLVRLNEALKQVLPVYFPDRAGLSNVWEGRVTVRDKTALHERRATILEVVKELKEALRKLATQGVKGPGRE